jgi:hypothetical protein
MPRSGGATAMIKHAKINEPGKRRLEGECAAFLDAREEGRRLVKAAHAAGGLRV